MLEFALALPVFFFAVMGTIEFGRGLFAANELNHLAREAVRYAVVRSSDSDFPTSADEVADFVRERAIGLVADEIDVDTDWDPSNVPGAFVATGHGPWGMLNAPATGQALAELLVDGASARVDLRPFAPPNSGVRPRL